MKLKKKHKVLLAVLLLYILPWVPAHLSVHRWIDDKENHFGDLNTKSVPVLPCVLLCWSDNMAGIGGRGALGMYVWYGFGVGCVFEKQLIVA